jgi:type I restriction enzyme, R subunit
MPSKYSEDQLVEHPVMQLLGKDHLGWKTANVFHCETFGQGGTIGRDSENDVLLRHRFDAAIRIMNPNLPDSAYTQAFDIISASTSTKSLTEINHEKYQYLRDGIPVKYKNSNGEVVNNGIRVFDFEESEKNDFLAVQQLWVKGKAYRRRPDVVGFVNGIPLLFVELKAHQKKLVTAYEHNLKDYKDTIPQMFHCNAFVILSNGLESKIGAATSKFQYYHDWKRIEEDAEGIVSLETIVRGVCDKSRFLDLFENFILFDDSVGSIVKLIARNHQFIGVNKAIKHFKEKTALHLEGKITNEERQKMGVFWHTQGSGKSYSMVFLAQKIHRKVVGSYTFLIVTDRNELDKQIYGTFAGVGLVSDKGVRAKSGKDLKRLLQTDSRFIFALIHKFNFEEEITQRSDIIVISDEAHRTQGGSLALNMRNAIPNAAYLGFTGTPLFKDDELTRRIFGKYVSIYDFKRSIEDNATVPLYYENRGEKLKLENPEITKQLRDAIEEADLDPDQRASVERQFAREYPIITAERRLRAIAKDVVWHFNNRGYKGKGMFVAIDKITAVKMYNFMREEWDTYIGETEKNLKKIGGDQERLAAERELKWTRETEISVVVSSEQNEIDKFKNWGLDIEPHRIKMNTRDLETDFKDEDHPFRFVIVCAMWITGFDVPSLSTMYIDKPMKSHTLMQTIARANRVHTGKNNGLIVDYIETYKSLLEALAIYGTGGRTGGGGGGGGTGGGEEPPVRPLEELIKELEEAIALTEVFLKNDLDFDLDTIVNPMDQLQRLAAIEKGVNAVYTTDDTKNKFGVLAREVFKRFKALLPDPSTTRFKARRDAINAIYAVIQENTYQADISAVMSRVQEIVDRSIATMDVTFDTPADYGVRVDLSSLDFEKIEKEFSKPERKNTTVQSLKTIVERKLNRMVEQNPTRIDFYERYQEIINEYNRGKDEVTIRETFDKIKGLINDLSEEEARATAEGLTEEQLAIFDLLRSDKELKDKQRHEVKEVARELLERLEQNELQVEHWVEKVQTAAAVRRAINDYLFEKLPYPYYNEDDIALQTDVVYEYVVAQYAA